MRAGVGGEEGQKKKRGDSLRMFDPMPQGNFNVVSAIHPTATRRFIYIYK